MDLNMFKLETCNQIIKFDLDSIYNDYLIVNSFRPSFQVLTVLNPLTKLRGSKVLTKRPG